MKRFNIVLAGALALAVALSAAPAIAGFMQIRIDAGNNPTPAAGWNVLPGGDDHMGRPVALTDVEGAGTGVTATLASVRRWNNIGTSSTDLLGKYAGTVLGDGTGYGLFIQQPSDSTKPWWGTLTFAGLEPESWQWYRIEMSASYDANYPATQDVQVNGQWADGDHTGQGFKADTHGYGQGIILRWDDVLPDANGLVTIYVARAGPLQTHDAFLNAVILTLVPEPSTALLPVFGGLSLALRRGRRRPSSRSEL